MKRQYLLHRGWDGAAAEPWTGRKVLDSNLLLVCHDEIVTDAAERDIDQQQELLVKSMTDAYRAVSMPKVINGVSRIVYLKDIYMEMDPIVASYWAKD
jgi:hypothetical protein